MWLLHGKHFLRKDKQRSPNKVYPTWSYISVNFLDAKVILKDRKIITDLYVKPTNTHQYLDSSWCHPYHCKKVSLTANLNNTLGKDPCGKNNYHVCWCIVNIDTFSWITTDETFKINIGPLNRYSKKAAYLSDCKTY